MKKLIAPSLLSADFANLQKDVEMVNNSQADWIHFDVMDGSFVPNISFGLPVLKAVKKYATKPIDVHLMIVNPEKYLEAFQEAGANSISVHIEACPHLHRNIQQIKKLNCLAGVAVNPHTPVSQLEDIIEDLDFVNLMTVNPGFGGQSLIENSYKKIKQLREMADKRGKDLLIEVDGGVTLENYQKLFEAGVNIFVAGNTVFGAPDPIATIAEMKKH
ncbi:ribulose-phosphate 3-epimerase [Flexithrix dorotheae]|uniref:ribulose-phosphate 3-epimerase n=1 Tax=Flexithrix dorotheae TaxID=70993 RepID=UPI000380B4D9|nr:ribulose-phosphate 3-epimerase [Flexithrix dorotheae]